MLHPPPPTPVHIRATLPSSLFDADGSGAIDAEEMALAMKGLGFGDQPREEIEKMIRSIDTDANGLIEYRDKCLTTCQKSI